MLGFKNFDRKVNKVTSGGQLSRSGKKVVPMPRVVYKLSPPSCSNPEGYLCASGGK